MNLLRDPECSPPQNCPYLSDRQSRSIFFLADQLGAPELELLLATGWRKFGTYYFRPFCDHCRQCIPVRVPVATYFPSKSRRRLLRKNSDISVSFGPLVYDDEILDIYREHSLARFGKNVASDELIINFQSSCPALLSRYTLNGALIAAGILDKSSCGLSSVYFVYRNSVCKRAPGIFSVLKEIEYTAALGLEYYYLGYYVPGNSVMAYKATFFPLQYYDWEQMEWHEVQSMEQIHQSDKE